MALPSMLQRSVDLPVRSSGGALSSPSRQRRSSSELRQHAPEITLYLEQKRTRPGASPYLEAVQVPISSTVRDVRLKLQNLKGWHADKARCALVRTARVHLHLTQTDSQCSPVAYVTINSSKPATYRYWGTGTSWNMRLLGSLPKRVLPLQITCMSLSSWRMSPLSVLTRRPATLLSLTSQTHLSECHQEAPSHIPLPLPSLSLHLSPRRTGAHLQQQCSCCIDRLAQHCLCACVHDFNLPFSMC